MTRTIIIFLLITGLLAKNYLIDVVDEGGHEGGEEGGDEEGGEGGPEVSDGKGSEGGSDFSYNEKLRMAMDAGRRFRSRRTRRLRKYTGDTLTLTCNVGSFG